MHRLHISARLYRLLSVFLLALALVAPVHSQSISLGIRTPVKPFMWRDGKSIDALKPDDDRRRKWLFLEANLDQLPAWGGEWNIVIVRQWSDGPDNFARIRRIVAEHEKHGVKVVLRVLEDPAVYTRMQDAESGEFGYDQAYYQWVQSLARATRGKVRCFLIGNEAELDLGKSYSDLPNAPRHLTLTYDQYARVLRTAVKAIKSVDPGLQVANSGFTDSSLAPAVAQDIYDTEGLTAAQEFWEAWKARDGVRAEGRVRLYRLLNNSEVKRKIDFVRRALREPMGSDLFQLHYYRNWQGLQPMLDWITGKCAPPTRCVRSSPRRWATTFCQASARTRTAGCARPSTGATTPRKIMRAT